MKIGEDRIDECVTHLNKLLEAEDQTPAIRYVWAVYGELLQAFPFQIRNSLGDQEFSDLVDLVNVFERVAPLPVILKVAGHAMMLRPGKPFAEDANRPVAENASTAKIIELFGVLASRAKEGAGSFSNQNVQHLLREVLTQNGHHMTMAQMKPFLEISADITFDSRYATSSLGEYQGPRTDCFQSIMMGTNVGAIPNQAWVALLNNCFESGPEGCEPQYVLNGDVWAKDFDRFALLILQMKEHDIKIPLHRTDVILVAQILERMTFIMAHEPGTERAHRMGEALCALVDVTTPIEKKITAKNNIYFAPGKRNPMVDDGYFNFCTLRSLKGASLQIDHPAAEQALEVFKYQVLMHMVQISPLFHKQDPINYTDKTHIAELAELCGNSLRQKKSLSPLNETGRMTLLSAMDETPLREHLLTVNMKVRKNLFVQELGI